MEGLKLVASKPARRARPEAETPSRRARASMAFQIWAWDKGNGARSKKLEASVYLDEIALSTYEISTPAARRSCQAKKVPTPKAMMMPYPAMLTTV